MRGENQPPPPSGMHLCRYKALFAKLKYLRNPPLDDHATEDDEQTQEHKRLLANTKSQV